MKVQFARGFSTPRKYFRVHKGKNYYEHYIKSLWNAYRDVKTLKELKVKRLRDLDKSRIPYLKLSPTEQSLSKRANKVAYMMRRRMTLTEAKKGVQITIKQLKEFLGTSLYKKYGRYQMRPNDSRERPMPFFENGYRTTIITRTFKDASRVGTYLNDVREAIYRRTNEPLEKYKSKYIIDANGEKKYFETNWEKLYNIKEQQEEIWKGEGRGSHDDDEDF